MNLGSQVVDIAREWIGTPYVHQASCQGAGTDCLGLIRGIWRRLHGAEPQAIPPYTMDWSEASGAEDLAAAGARWFDPVEPDCHVPGDVILFRMREGAPAKHLGIAACLQGQPSFVHAYSGHAVVESFLTLPWQRRIAARFRFRDRG